MPCKVHGIVKDSQDLDHPSASSLLDTEEKEVAAFALLSGDVEREKAGANVIARSNPDER